MVSNHLWYLFVVLTLPSLQRPAWLYALSSFRLGPISYYICSPYFHNVNTIFFLAFIPRFNEQLVEDRNINHFADSFVLRKMICSSPQLSQTTLILLMNKCDLLEKIKNGGNPCRAMGTGLMTWRVLLNVSWVRGRAYMYRMLTLMDGWL